MAHLPWLGPWLIYLMILRRLILANESLNVARIGRENLRRPSGRLETLLETLWFFVQTGPGSSAGWVQYRGTDYQHLSEHAHEAHRV